jgi:hypothetical protein
MGHEVEKKETQKVNKFGFYCTRHSVRLFVCQHGVMSNHEKD